MSEPRVQYVGERNPSISDVIASGGSPVDLTSSTVRFKMRLIGSSTPKVDAAATVTDAPNGAVRYDWAALDVDTPGFYVGWWEVTTSSKTQSKPEFLLEFRAHGVTAGNLIELHEARQSMELREIADELDDQIMSLIPAASQALTLEFERELVATADATRVFAAEGCLVDLAPYDLRSATTVTLDPNGAALVLVANGDYYLQPTGGDDFGVYTEVQLSNYLTVAPQSIFRFGVAEIAIRGAWGFATVPEIAKKACCITIRSWLRRDSVRGAYVDPDMNVQPDPGAYYALPPAARRLMDPLRRAGGVI